MTPERDVGGMKQEKPWTDKQLMVDLRQQGLTYAEIAEKLGCSDATACKWMKKHRAEERYADLDVDVPDEKPWRDEELLRKLYVDEKLTTNDISILFDCSNNTVCHWLEETGIGTRNQSDSMKYALGHHPREVPLSMHSKGYMRWNYSDQEGNKASVFVHRLLAVAEYGFEAVVGNDVHHKNGIQWDNRPSNIELLDHAEHSSVTNTILSDKQLDEIAERYEEGESTREIAEDYDVSYMTILYQLRKRDDVSLRSYKEAAKYAH